MGIVAVLLYSQYRWQRVSHPLAGDPVLSGRNASPMALGISSKDD